MKTAERPPPLPDQAWPGPGAAGRGELGAAYRGHQRIAGRPRYFRRREEVPRAVGHPGRTGVAGGCDHRDAVVRLGGQPVRPAQRFDHGAGLESRLGRAEALADHVGEMMPDDILLSLDDLREAAPPLNLRVRRLHQQDLRPRCHRVRPLDVQRRLAGGTCPRLGRPVAGHHASRLDHPQRQRRQAKPLVENGRVMRDGRRSEWVDDRNRLALAVDTRPQERPQVIGRPRLRRAQASTRRGLRRAQASTRRGRRPARPALNSSLPVSASARAPRQAHGHAKRHRPGAEERMGPPALTRQGVPGGGSHVPTVPACPREPPPASSCPTVNSRTCLGFAAASAAAHAGRLGLTEPQI